MAAVNKPLKALICYLRRAWLAAFCLVVLATVLPLLSFSLGERYWPGFFYLPFYTNSVVTDPQTPAAIAGLKPEDRVIGLNGVRIEYLHEITARQGRAGGNITLVYELGLELASINLPVERLNWDRLLEKWSALLVGGVGLAVWGWRKRQGLAMAGAMLMVASGDYLLNPGAGRESGFDPGTFMNIGTGGLATAKWSTYFYWPLWLLVWLIVGLTLINQLKGFQSRKLLRFLRIVAITCALSGLAVYFYEAARTARYNNPDYITFYFRLVWWPAWAALLALGIWAFIKNKKWQGWLGLAGMALLVVGYGAVILYAVKVPGPGPQWYALGLVLAGWAWAYSGKAAKPFSNSAG